MNVDCEGCAGCCLDWRPVAPGSLDHERRGPRPPLDDAYNLVPLTRDEVTRLLEQGYGDAMTPRLWRAKSSEERVVVDGVDVAAIDGGPVFFVGLRKLPKPVAPFGIERTWLRSCVFLDPETLQCRVHGDRLYPDECEAYPGHNLAVDAETECERVESAFGGSRLLDATPPADAGRILLGPQAVGAKLFVHPEPSRLEGVVERMQAGDLTRADRAEFVGVAAGSHPGATEIDEERAETARLTALAASSWVGAAAADWTGACEEIGSPADGRVDRSLETRHGAPETPGW
jgi:hypothetical protein